MLPNDILRVGHWIRNCRALRGKQRVFLLEVKVAWATLAHARIGGRLGPGGERFALIDREQPQGRVQKRENKSGCIENEWSEVGKRRLGLTYAFRCPRDIPDVVRRYAHTQRHWTSPLWALGPPKFLRRGSLLFSPVGEGEENTEERIPSLFIIKTPLTFPFAVYLQSPQSDPRKRKAKCWERIKGPRPKQKRGLH